MQRNVLQSAADDRALLDVGVGNYDAALDRGLEDLNANQVAIRNAGTGDELFRLQSAATVLIATIHDLRDQREALIAERDNIAVDDMQLAELDSQIETLSAKDAREIAETTADIEAEEEERERAYVAQMAAQAFLGLQSKAADADRQRQEALQHEFDVQIQKTPYYDPFYGKG